MFDETQKYIKQDHFFWKGDNPLSEDVKQVPEDPGVFFVYRLARGGVELVYIGHTLLESGKDLRSTGLREEISELDSYFKPKFKKESIDALDIYWFVTLDDSHHDLPPYVSGILMQRHYEINGNLPLWNVKFG